MKLLTSALILLLFSGCAMNNIPTKRSSIALVAMNSGHPLVSADLANKIGSLIIESRYPADVFLIVGPGRVEDNGDCWEVTYSNSLVNEDGSLDQISMIGDMVVPRNLTLVIRKYNAELMDIR